MCCALVGGLWFVGACEAGGALACAAAALGMLVSLCRDLSRGLDLQFLGTSLQQHRLKHNSVLLHDVGVCYCLRRADCLKISVRKLTCKYAI